MEKKDKRFYEFMKRIKKQYESYYTDLNNYTCKSCGIKFELDILEDLCYSCHCRHALFYSQNRDRF